MQTYVTETSRSHTEGDQLAIHPLLGRSWFERLWVRQEIDSANANAIVTCGSVDVLRQTFRNPIYGLCCKPLRVVSEEIILAEFLKLIKTSYLISLATSTDSPVDLLHQTVTAKCSNPRDRVFAMLGMTRKDMGIKPGYVKTVERMYRDFALRYIERYDLRILPACDLRISWAKMPRGYLIGLREHSPSV